ncbi:MAG TPA: methyltransferase [Epsilonproteobacteria bacterium]|nr:methyltransferase [Arcobacter sp.]HHD79897.1 methyltransferase [Campylobacterota bacterium]
MFIEESEEAKAIKEFSRFAHEYNAYNVIQAEVAKRLVGKLPKKQYNCILDIGSGSGEIYKNISKNKINFDRFISLDSSVEMLGLHPVSPKIEKISADFNKFETFKQLDVSMDETLLLSSSALQWSKNLDFVFAQLAKKSYNAYFAIFTANTFKTLHKTAQLKSPIYPPEVLKESLEKYYNANFELKEYRLEFESVREMFHYIKKSGVSGGEKKLSYREIKELMCKYPLAYLEFEVLFVEAISLTKCK